MTRAVRPSRPFQTQWVKPSEKPAPAPLTAAQQKARRLPRPGPGILISVPLDCLMEYLGLYHLAPDGIREPKFQPERGPGEAILLVRHSTNGDKDERENKHNN